MATVCCMLTALLHPLTTQRVRDLIVWRPNYMLTLLHFWSPTARTWSHWMAASRLYADSTSFLTIYSVYVISLDGDPPIRWPYFFTVRPPTAYRRCVVLSVKYRNLCWPPSVLHPAVGSKFFRLISMEWHADHMLPAPGSTCFFLIVIEWYVGRLTFSQLILSNICRSMYLLYLLHNPGPRYYSPWTPCRLCLAPRRQRICMSSCRTVCFYHILIAG